MGVWDAYILNCCLVGGRGYFFVIYKGVSVSVSVSVCCCDESIPQDIYICVENNVNMIDKLKALL